MHPSISQEDKARARSIMATAIRNGLLERATHCQDCGGTQRKALDGHHEDYTKPLDVVWLCARCHRRRHSIWRNVETVKNTFFISTPIFRALREVAFTRDVPKRLVVEEALRQYLGVHEEAA